MKKRLVSLLLVVMMILGSSLSTNAKYFSDLTTYLDEELFDAINYMSDNGYMNGTSEGIFNPDMNVTRGMLVYLLYVYLGDNGTYTNPFSDVYPSQYYANAVGWAYNNEITSGTSATTFSPNTTLTREQLICILYNCAKKFEGVDLTKISSTAYTACVDAANVSSYAIPAINWALHYKILELDSSNRLGPKDVVSRSIMVLYVYRYSLNIEQINYDKDVMSISHTTQNFGTKYYLSDSDKTKIDTCIKEFYGNNSVPTKYKSIVSNQTYRAWGGSCFGITMVTALDKLGYLAFNENFTDKDSMEEITDIGNNLEAQSVINAYQLSQSYSFGINTRYYSNNSNYSSGLNGFINSVKENPLVVFGFYWRDATGKSHGHAILAYDYIKNSNGSHTIKAYDCNYNNTPIEININAALSNCTVPKYTNTGIYGFAFIDEFDSYKNFYDFDGVYNDMNSAHDGDAPLYDEDTTNGNSASGYDESDVVDVKVLSYGDYSIESEEGEDIIVDNGEVSGTIEIYDELTLPEYENNVCTTTYTVPQSGCYVLEIDEDEFVFEIYGEHYNTTLSGTCNGNASIIIGWDGYVYLDENVETFDLLTCVDNDNYDIIKISGSTNGDSTFCIGDTGATLDNISSSLNVTYTNYEENIDNSVTIPYSGSDVTLIYPTN